MNNKDLLKSFVCPPESFVSFVKEMKSGWNYGQDISKYTQDLYSSNFNKDYFIANTRCWTTLAAGVKDFEIIGLYKWQYHQFLKNLRSKRFRARVSNAFCSIAEMQRYKKMLLNNEIIVSIYDINSKKYFHNFTPFVLLGERKKYSSSLSQVKRGVLKPLPF